MSGYTSFTYWITCSANYVVVNGNKERILDGYFVSDGMHNSDIFTIKTEKGLRTLSDQNLDYEELSNRFRKTQTNEI